MADAEASKSKKVFYRDSKGELHALKPGQENPDQKREREKTDEDRHYDEYLEGKSSGKRRRAKGGVRTQDTSVAIRPISRHELRRDHGRDETLERHIKVVLYTRIFYTYFIYKTSCPPGTYKVGDARTCCTSFHHRFDLPLLDRRDDYSDRL